MGPASKRARPAAEVLVIDDSDDEAPPQAAEAALNSFKQPPAAAVAANGHDAQEEEGGDGIGGAGALTTALAFEAVHQARLLEQCQARLAVLPDRIASQLLFNGDGGEAGRPGQWKRGRAALDEVRAMVLRCARCVCRWARTTTKLIDSLIHPNPANIRTNRTPLQNHTPLPAAPTPPPLSSSAFDALGFSRGPILPPRPRRLRHPPTQPPAPRAPLLPRWLAEHRLEQAEGGLKDLRQLVCPKALPPPPPPPSSPPPAPAPVEPEPPAPMAEAEGEQEQAMEVEPPAAAASAAAADAEAAGEEQQKEGASTGEQEQQEAEASVASRSAAEAEAAADSNASGAAAAENDEGVVEGEELEIEVVGVVDEGEGEDEEEATEGEGDESYEQDEGEDEEGSLGEVRVCLHNFIAVRG